MSAVMVIPIQQLKPKRMGLVPDFTSLTISVFKPMAVIAMMMKNLLRFFMGAKVSAVTPKLMQIVVNTEAKTKYRIKVGKAFLKLKVLCPPLFFLE